MKLRNLREFLEKQNPNAEVMIQLYSDQFEEYYTVPVKSVNVIMKEGQDDITYYLVLCEELGD